MGRELVELGWGDWTGRETPLPYSRWGVGELLEKKNKYYYLVL